jgi:SAM-dependent methyltransferase
MTTEATIFDHLTALADPTRGRLLLVLESSELTVTELCAVLQMPQSSVSRHLKVLADGGWVAARPDGTSRLYRLDTDELDPVAAELWRATRAEIASLPAAVADRLRKPSVLALRATKSQEFFASAAGSWDHLRRELFGARGELLGLLGFLDDTWVVGDLGCGTGQAAASLAPFVGTVIGVDGSASMLEIARERLAGAANVEFRRGELEALPLQSGELDAAVLFLVLHHVAEPGRVFAEVARVLKPEGRLLVVDMMAHDRQDYRREMGHVWLGFSRPELLAWLTAAGFGPVRIAGLPPDPEAAGPPLFAAAAKKSDSVPPHH